MAKLRGRKRRAAAAGAYRSRRSGKVRQMVNEPPAKNSNRANYRQNEFPVVQMCPERGCCAICGKKGVVIPHSQ